MCVQVHLSAGAYGGQRKASDLQELELQVVWPAHLGYGELKPGPLGENCALSFLVISATPAYHFLLRRHHKSSSNSIVQGVEVSPSLGVKKIKVSPQYVFSWIATELPLLSKAWTGSIPTARESQGQCQDPIWSVKTREKSHTIILTWAKELEHVTPLR